MIPVQNIYHMLAYAFRVLNEDGYRSVATEQFHNVAELCAAILIKGVSLQIKRGLEREYVIRDQGKNRSYGIHQNTDSAQKADGLHL